MLVNKTTRNMNTGLTKPLAHARRATLSCAIASLVAACAGPLPPAESPSTAAPVFVGSVDSVNRATNSVVIDVSGEGSSLNPGTDLTAISPAGEATRLKVTGESKRPRLSAAVVSGTPKRGQRVYR